jgi:Arc/MetJ-type ribon-helix-helix transcriptional regulator
MADSLTITLTPELSARVRAHMDRADHPSAETVIERALSVLDDEASPIEPWELEHIRAACEELDRDHSNVFTSEQIDEQIEAEFQRQEAAIRLAQAG